MDPYVAVISSDKDALQDISIALSRPENSLVVSLKEMGVNLPELRAQISSLVADRTLITQRMNNAAVRGSVQTYSIIDSAEETGLGVLGATLLRRFVRPAYFVVNGTVVIADTASMWAAKLAAASTKLNVALAASGRVEVSGHDNKLFVGTGWLVAPSIVVTNRHVASEFAHRNGESFEFSLNSVDHAIGARVDFLAERDSFAQAEFKIEKVLHLEDVSGPDLAFFRVKSEGVALPNEIPLSTDVTANADVVAIGYPFRDAGGNNPETMDLMFESTYDVKRCSPGKIKNISEREFTHDCSTLKGSSGSVILDLNSGMAVGIHFSGTFEVENTAVKAAEIKERLQTIAHWV